MGHPSRSALARMARLGDTTLGVPTARSMASSASASQSSPRYKNHDELWACVSRLAHEFTADNYDVLTHNCNHFSDKVRSEKAVT